MTKSQIDRLGQRLRAQGPLDPQLLAQLQELRPGYHAPMSKAQELLRERLGIEATSRLKTVNTIVEKLRRESTRLSGMQDVAGLRVVEEMGLPEQDALVEMIVALFPGARVVDRRKLPKHGYRAVHLIPQVDGFPIEIQVRTQMQDL